jgi:hypothetical protein
MTQKLKLDLGCGKSPQKGYIGVDIGFSDENIIRSDALAHLKTLPSESVSHFYSRHYLEHMAFEDLQSLLREMDRVLIKGGEMKLIVPHFSNPYYYSDPTHKTPFGVHTFSYFCEKTCLRRYVPNYVAIPGWSLDHVRVNFVSIFNFKLMGIKFPKPANILNRLVNLNTYLAEVFERYFSFILSIYEVEFHIHKM